MLFDLNSAIFIETVKWIYNRTYPFYHIYEIAIGILHISMCMNICSVISLTWLKNFGMWFFRCKIWFRSIEAIPTEGPMMPI